MSGLGLGIFDMLHLAAMETRLPVFWKGAVKPARMREVQRLVAEMVLGV